MFIRKMEVEDLDEILYLENELFPLSSWNKEAFLFELNENPMANYFVLENKQSNEIVGYLGEWITYENAQITTIGIKKEYQGNHLSRLLLDKAIDLTENSSCEVITLEVRVTNEKAISLYKSYDFEVVTIRKNYYGNNMDAYLMLLDLKEVAI